MNVLAACAGGITTAVLLGHLAALRRRPRRHRDLPGHRARHLGAVDGRACSSPRRPSPRRCAARSGAASSPAPSWGASSRWLRPNDLVWNYWVNNYLLGADPPAFDILYWNNDATNLPAALHADFLALYLENSLCTPGRLEVLGTPIDLGRVTADVYAVGALTDHITPWEACYRTPQLFGGAKHLRRELERPHPGARQPAAGNAKSRYFTNDDLAGRREATGSPPRTEQKGTLVDALGRRGCGALRRRAARAPAELGSAAHPPLMAGARPLRPPGRALT